MIRLGEIGCLFVVSLLWGFTNPLMGRGSKGLLRVHRDNFILQFLAEIKFLFTNWKYVLPLVVNQSGSLLFYFALSFSDLSMAVPLTNGLTFLFTAVASRLLGEKSLSPRSYSGMALVVLGVGLCVADKSIM